MYLRSGLCQEPHHSPRPSNWWGGARWQRAPSPRTPSSLLTFSLEFRPFGPQEFPLQIAASGSTSQKRLKNTAVPLSAVNGHLTTMSNGQARLIRKFSNRPTTFETNRKNSRFKSRSFAGPYPKLSYPQHVLPT